DGNRKVVHAEVAGEIREFTAAEILVATGRHPAITGLDLARAGVRQTHREVPVDDQLRTNVPHIFAAGDVIGRNYIVHYAIQQAEVAAYNAVSGNPPRAVDNRLIPHVVFTDPQFGRVGLTEKEARAAGRDVLVGKYPFADHGKAMCLGRTAGFVKLVADRATGEILGAAVLGPEGGELLHEMVVAMHFRATAAEFLKIPHVHPTLAEILTYPAEDIEDQRQALVQAV
ncbi:MAG: NAD(P)/FAD-dependent oxidoreductase, partial [Candidatus Sericytochromatia bacterium]|nr:NAD(P)/FAD-dependent oxidoreductase [Candidatus Tanganyikabacteria bacterium]